MDDDQNTLNAPAYPVNRKGRKPGTPNKKTVIKQTLEAIKQATGVQNEAELDPLVGLAWAAAEAKRMFLLQQSAIEAQAVPVETDDGEEGPPGLPLPQMMGIAKDWLGMYVRALEVLAPYMHARKVQVNHANKDGTGNQEVVVKVVSTGVPRAPSVGTMPLHGQDGLATAATQVPVMQ